MNQRSGDFEGILLVDKPQGITSHDVVNRLRRKINMKRIGHAGTLDPMATGLLIMLVGKATKTSQYLISLDKTYEGTIKFGVETDSQDADGQVVAETPLPEGLNGEIVLKEMETFLGDQYQLKRSGGRTGLIDVDLFNALLFSHEKQFAQPRRQTRHIH